MTQETQSSAEAEAQEGQMTDEQQRTDFSTLPVDVQRRMKELQEEAKLYRKQKSDAEKQRQTEETARLLADKQWETLATKYKTDLDAIAPRAERLDAMEQFLTEMAQKRIQGLPAHFRPLVPEYEDPLKTLAWLEANAATLSLPKPPPMGQGGQGDNAGSQELTPELEDYRKKFNLTKEQVQKAQNRK